MFTPNRFVVVDDEIPHLEAIRAALEGLGTSCVAVHYDVVTGEVPREPFENVRVVFMDLQLQSHSPGTDFKVHYAVIQSLLEKVICEDSGPYVMVLWSTRSEQATELQEYLADNVPEDLRHVRPLKVIEMSKQDFLPGASGNGDAAARLRLKVQETVQAVPALAALLTWEAEIIAASDRVVRDVASLARTEDYNEPDLGTALWRLAEQAVGPHNVLDDPQAAVHTALLPLLADHVQYDMVGTDDPPSTFWDELFRAPTSLGEVNGDDLPADTGDTGAEGDPPPILPNPAPLNRATAAALNSHLHLGGRTGRLSPTSWGAICLAGDVDWLSEFGVTDLEYRTDLGRSFKQVGGGLAPAVNEALLVQVRIGAACDYAQQKAGPIPYAVGAFVPLAEYPANEEAAADTGSKGSQPKRPKYPAVLGPIEMQPTSLVWSSPMLDLAGLGVGQIVIDPRFVRVRGEGAAKAFEPIDRIREQLLLELIAAVSHHSSRPGIVRYLGADTKPLHV